MSGEILECCDICGREVVVYVQRRHGNVILCSGCLMEEADRPSPSPGLAPPRPAGCPSCAQAEAEVDRMKASLDLEALARKAAADGLADAKSEIDRLNAALRLEAFVRKVATDKLENMTAESVALVLAVERFASYVVTCLQANTPEWMEGLAEEVNDVLESIGEPDRFEVGDGALRKVRAPEHLDEGAPGYPNGFHNGHDTFEEWRGER